MSYGSPRVSTLVSVTHHPSPVIPSPSNRRNRITFCPFGTCCYSPRFLTSFLLFRGTACACGQRAKRMIILDGRLLARLDESAGRHDRLVNGQMCFMGFRRNAPFANSCPGAGGLLYFKGTMVLGRGGCASGKRFLGVLLFCVVWEQVSPIFGAT